jgi:uncharacterized membrane protein YgcG
VWANSTRTITGGSLSVAPPTAADVWAFASRTLTGASLSSGSLATLADVTSASTSLGASVALVAPGVNANVDARVLAASTSLAASISSSTSAVNANTVSQLASSVSSVNSNTNAAVLSASTSLAAGISSSTSAVNAFTSSQLASAVSAVNANTDARVLTASTSLAATLPLAVWASGARTLTGFGTLAADVWNVATSTLTTPGTIGSQLATNVDARVSLSGGLSVPSVSDIWSFGSRTLTGASIGSGSLALQSDVMAASTSLSASIASNASAINLNTNNVVGSASSSLAAVITALPSFIWSYGTRTFTSAGTLATDIWNATTRTLTSLTLSSQSPWTVSSSDFGTITAGSNYLATLTTVYNGTLTDSMNVPVVTIYDPNRNVIVNNVVMSRTATGTYSYAYATPGNAPEGVWETVFSANVESGKTLPGNDYWNVVTTPAQVIINSFSDVTVPQVAANITITNEGLSGYEYQYEWCVVSSVNNVCGGGDDVFHAIAAKYINSGEDFNTTLTADVPTPGNYFFKVVAYFGTDSSVASRTFTATGSTDGGSSGGGASSGGSSSGGGGGSSSNSSTVVSNDAGTCRRSDFNCDKAVSSTDFSILLYYWKSKPPFKNARVDINKDGKVDSVDFSILLYEWDRKVR